LFHVLGPEVKKGVDVCSFTFLVGCTGHYGVYDIEVC